ncbi:GntR family transcriptional regulator [Piscinibacter sakaiensis]|uniref:Transcriptional regulator, GntR family n=1 Tax=Piscinibacter sakaiensis TaxID=1547922 RepID=A0A0K8NZ22_PISS1|nr:GntR family transcriptional regulator [Piscinibacter sakaiensis]GAP35554.1 transcriptional regulator, GntR family [Piscinibacter sakaiensis]
MSHATPGGLPKHALITRALEAEIRAGRHPLGSTLPSEPELMHQFGVSRHTVRAALRTLQDRGLVQPHQGRGSVVRATTAERRYTQGFASAEDLLQYVASTRAVQTERQALVVDAALAAWLGCRPGEHWWRLGVLRCPLDSDEPSTLADVYLPSAYGTLLADAPSDQRPIFRAIEEELGEVIAEIRQEITAVLPTPAEAAALALGPGEPVLAIVRRYLGRDARVLEVTRTLHRARDFTYTMKLRLAGAGTPPHPNHPIPPGPEETA